MKNKRIVIITSISLVITGLLIFVFIFEHKNSTSSQMNAASPLAIPDSYRAASISKGTIFILLAVGVIGVLGVSRKKKNADDGVDSNQLNDSTINSNLKDEKISASQENQRLSDVSSRSHTRP